MAFIFVADGGDAVWVGSAKNPKKVVREIGTMQRVSAGGAAPALTTAPIVYQEACPTKRAQAVESRAHELLADTRIFQNWFACPAQTAIDALQKALAEP